MSVQSFIEHEVLQQFK